MTVKERETAAVLLTAVDPAEVELRIAFLLRARGKIMVHVPCVIRFPVVGGTLGMPETNVERERL